MAGHDGGVGPTVEQLLAGNTQTISDDTADKLERMSTLLAKRLGPEHLANRQGGGGAKLTYIEGWRVINLANEVFGFDGWSSEVRDMNVDYVDYNQETQRWNMGVTATVRVTLKSGTFHEDVGIGKMENSKSKGDALDKIKKEAVTDGLKRALRTFGNLLGNCIYDKHYLEDIAKVKPPPRPKLEFNELHRSQRIPIRPGAPAAPAPVKPELEPYQPVAGPSKARPGDVAARPQHSNINTINNARNPNSMQPPRQPGPATSHSGQNKTQARQTPAINQNATSVGVSTIPAAAVQPLTVRNLHNHASMQGLPGIPDTLTGEYWGEAGEDDSMFDGDGNTEDPDFIHTEIGVNAGVEAEDSGFSEIADKSTISGAANPANRPNRPPVQPANPMGQDQNAIQNKPLPPQRPQQTHDRAQLPRRQSIPTTSMQQRQPPSREVGQGRQARPRLQDGSSEMDSAVLCQDANFFGGEGYGQLPIEDIPAQVAFQNARCMKRDFDEGPAQRSQGMSGGVAQSGLRNISQDEVARIEQNKAYALALQQAKRQKNALGEAARC